MSKFVRSEFSIKRLTDNSYKAIDEGVYDNEKYNFYNHSFIDLKKKILSCNHAPIIAEIKFSSPSRGRIFSNNKINVIDLAAEITTSGSIGLSVLTQPYLFNGSIEYIGMIRKAIDVPILMKDIIVSEIQIDAAKRIGSDCILLIKSIFDQNLTEGSMAKFTEFALNKGLQVIFEVHSEKEYEEVISVNKRYRYRPNILIGINNRNLNDMRIDLNNTVQILENHDKERNVIISESGINSQDDIQLLKKAGADAFLVGTSIMESEDIAKKVKELYLSI
jgi:indole-3-glycerol phosphate synthase